MYSSLKAALFAVSLLPATSAAQTIEFAREDRTGFAIEALRPSLADGNTSLASAAYFLSAHQQLGDLRLVIEIPTAYASSDEEFSENGSVIGNPYLGFQFARGSSVLDLGVRIPLSEQTNDARFVGFLADAMRMEAFAPDLASMRLSVRQQAVLSRRTYFEFQIAPVLWIPTGENGSDKEVVLGYGGSFGYRAPALRLQGGVGGRAILTESGVDLAERTIHQFGLKADFGAGRVRPGLYAAVPLDDDFSEMVDAVFGITLQVGVSR